MLEQIFKDAWRGKSEKVYICPSKEVKYRNSVHDFKKNGDGTRTCTVCGVKSKDVTNFRGELVEGARYLKKWCNKYKAIETSNSYVGRFIVLGDITAFPQEKSYKHYGTTKQVVEAPRGYLNDLDGVWVNIDGEPFKVLNYEFEFTNNG